MPATRVVLECWLGAHVAALVVRAVLRAPLAGSDVRGLGLMRMCLPCIIRHPCRFKEGQAVQAEQAAQPVDWSAPDPAPTGRRLQGSAAAAQPQWMEPAQLGGVMADFASSVQDGHSRGLLAKKKKCKFTEILGVFTDR